MDLLVFTHLTLFLHSMSVSIKRNKCSVTSELIMHLYLISASSLWHLWLADACDLLWLLQHHSAPSSHPALLLFLHLQCKQELHVRNVGYTRALALFTADNDSLLANVTPGLSSEMTSFTLTNGHGCLRSNTIYQIMFVNFYCNWVWLMWQTNDPYPECTGRPEQDVRLNEGKSVG